MQLGTCSCPHGTDGAPCSHQAAVSKHFHVHSVNSIASLFPEKRQELAIIALGNQAERNLAYFFSLYKNLQPIKVGWRNLHLIVSHILHYLCTSIPVMSSLTIGYVASYLLCSYYSYYT